MREEGLSFPSSTTSQIPQHLDKKPSKTSH